MTRDCCPLFHFHAEVGAFTAVAREVLWGLSIKISMSYGIYLIFSYFD